MKWEILWRISRPKPVYGSISRSCSIFFQEQEEKSGSVGEIVRWRIRKGASKHWAFGLFWSSISSPISNLEEAGPGRGGRKHSSSLLPFLVSCIREREVSIWGLWSNEYWSRLFEVWACEWTSRSEIDHVSKKSASRPESSSFPEAWFFLWFGDTLSGKWSFVPSMQSKIERREVLLGTNRLSGCSWLHETLHWLLSKQDTSGVATMLLDKSNSKVLFLLDFKVISGSSMSISSSSMSNTNERRIGGICAVGRSAVTGDSDVPVTDPRPARGRHWHLKMEIIIGLSSLTGLQSSRPTGRARMTDGQQIRTLWMFCWASVACGRLTLAGYSGTRLSNLPVRNRRSGVTGPAGPERTRGKTIKMQITHETQAAAAAAV